jgi:hypothetical protein
MLHQGINFRCYPGTCRIFTDLYLAFRWFNPSNVGVHSMTPQAGHWRVVMSIHPVVLQQLGLVVVTHEVWHDAVMDDFGSLVRV